MMPTTEGRAGATGAGTPIVMPAYTRWLMARAALAAVCARHERDARRAGKPIRLTTRDGPLPGLAEQVRSALAAVACAAPRGPGDIAVKATVALTLLDEGGDVGATRDILAAVVADIGAMPPVPTAGAAGIAASAMPALATAAAVADAVVRVIA